MQIDLRPRPTGPRWRPDLLELATRWSWRSFAALDAEECPLLDFAPLFRRVRAMAQRPRMWPPCRRCQTPRIAGSGFILPHLCRDARSAAGRYGLPTLYRRACRADTLGLCENVYRRQQAAEARRFLNRCIRVAIEGSGGFRNLDSSAQKACRDSFRQLVRSRNPAILQPL